MKKYIPSIKKNAEGISVNSILLKRKNDGKNASKKDDTNAMRFPNNIFAVRYVNIIMPTPNNKTDNFPKNTTSNPSFQKKPKINGQTKGREASYNPDWPEEYIYFPMPR